MKPSTTVLPAGDSPFPEHRDAKKGPKGTSELCFSGVSIGFLLGGMVEGRGRSSDYDLLHFPHDKPHPSNGSRNHESLAGIKTQNRKVFVRSRGEKNNRGKRMFWIISRVGQMRIIGIELR